ncbi:CesT family type III secretion system chaperone [Achromobacter xylosoxidans]
MHSNFTEAIVQLWSELGLAPPLADDLHSLQVGEHVVHIAERPQGHILMFISIETELRANAQMVHEQNLFNSDTLSPIISMDESEHRWLVWNRQPILLCKTATLRRQLEQVIDCAERFCGM